MSWAISSRRPQAQGEEKCSHEKTAAAILLLLSLSPAASQADPRRAVWPSVEQQMAKDRVVPGSALEQLILENQEFDLLRSAEARDRIPVPLWLRVWWRKNNPQGDYSTSDPTGGYPHVLKEIHEWMITHQDLLPGIPEEDVEPGIEGMFQRAERVGHPGELLGSDPDHRRVEQHLRQRPAGPVLFDQRRPPCAPQTLYSDGFESGTGLAGWSTGTFVAGGSAASWRGIQTCTAHGGSKIFRHGGTTCTGNYTNDEFAFAQPNGAAGISVPAGSTATRLSFWHRREFENGFDGGTLAVSLDGADHTLVRQRSSPGRPTTTPPIRRARRRAPKTFRSSPAPPPPSPRPQWISMRSAMRSPAGAPAAAARRSGSASPRSPTARARATAGSSTM
jgi:hypothetical protein